jgi:hypothetical protein
MFYTFHNVNSSSETKDAILNCNYFVFFKASMVGIPYALDKIGIAKKEQAKYLNLPARYFCFHKNAPNYLIYDCGVQLIT